MSYFEKGDRVVVVNRQDKWAGKTGTVHSVQNRGYSQMCYTVTMDERYSEPMSFTDGISCTFHKDHLETYIEPVEDEEDFVEDDYTRSARIVKNYMEDHRLLSGDLSEYNIIVLIGKVFEADYLGQGYSDNYSRDTALDKAASLYPYLETIRPALETHWRADE